MLARMCDEAHEQGALAGIELGHTGVQAENSESRLPSAAPSQLASDFATGVVPKAMTRRDIRRLVDDWAVAARRSREAGFDIVYVYGGHTYLMGQFLSPHYNRRTDEYGGSLANRARAWLETLEAVRDAVGDDCAIACRVAVDRLDALGVDLDEGLEFVTLADHLVDLWDVNVGSISEWHKDSGPSRFYAEGWQLESTGRVREATAKPIVGVGRLTDPDLMAAIVRSGAWDLIGAARPSIADPFLPRKVEEGRYDDIRECIGCNVCIARGRINDRIVCTQNATAGEEYRRGWHPERFEPAANAGLDVLVVGGGPAGMECAIVLAKRGFRRVHLVEASRDVGGHATLLASLPGLQEWRRVVDWRRGQLASQRNVEVIAGTELDADGVREYGAELVVVATGSRWAADGTNPFTHAPIPGAGHALTPEAALAAEPVAGERVLVYDCEGYAWGAGLAERYAAAGAEVRLVTPLVVAAPYLNFTFEGYFARGRLDELGVAVDQETMLTEVRPDGATLVRFGRETAAEADRVVLVTARRSQDALYRALREDPGEIEAVYAVGDCVAPRQLADAIFDGHRLGREIDLPDPMRPLPYLRERAVAGALTAAPRGSYSSPIAPS
jgi:dimethylamine/trimethylamine dehydrogenase